jgi:hypothetical protein
MTANVQGVADVNAQAVFRVLAKPFDIGQMIAHVREAHSTT